MKVFILNWFVFRREDGKGVVSIEYLVRVEEVRVGGRVDIYKVLGGR